MKNNKSKHKSFSLSNIPDDVMWVWALEYMQQPIGSKMYDKVEEIVEKYPEYFTKKNEDL